MVHALILVAQATDGAAKPEANPWGMLGTFAPLILIFAAFYFLVIMPQRRRERREREELFVKLKKNDEVVTTAGIIGIVAMVKDNDEVVLKLDESANARIRVLKSSIARILNPKEPAKDAAGKPADTADNVKAGVPPQK